MIKTKVQLIRPPVDDWYGSERLTDLESVPTGLLILASRIRSLQNIDVEVIDGLNKPIEYIINQIDGDIVGTTTMYSNYINNLKVLNVAKLTGAKTLIGGPNTTFISKRILKNNPFIDYVVVGDGEDALPAIARNAINKKTPNITYREGNAIIQNKSRMAELNTLFDLENVVDQNYKTTNAVPISSIRGCIKAELGKRCSFCSMQHGLAIMNPNLVWDQIKLLNEKYGFDYFFESGDTFIVNDFPQQLLNAKPDDINPFRLRFYIIPNQINEEVADLLVKLNMHEVVMGIESANNDILKAAGKSYIFEDVIRAAKILSERIENIHVPFIFGLNGESEQSAERTYEFAKGLKDSFSSVRIVSSFAIPFPGTALFEQIRLNSSARREYSGNIDEDDSFDYRDLVRLQIKYFTKISFEKAKEFVKRTKNLVDREGYSTSYGINRRL